MLDIHTFLCTHLTSLLLSLCVYLCVYISVLKFSDSISLKYYIVLKTTGYAQFITTLNIKHVHALHMFDS